MSLQGSIETFAVADVLRLLAATSKSGRLHVQGPSRSGTIWVDSARVLAAESPSTPHVGGSVDVLFQMLRFERGSFRFEIDKYPPEPGEPIDIELALGEAESMLGEWRELEARVPSPEAWVTLAPSLADGRVTIDEQEWKTLVAVAGGRTVAGIGDAGEASELANYRAINRLLDLGLVTIAERAPLRAEARTAEPVAAAAAVEAPADVAAADVVVDPAPAAPETPRTVEPPVANGVYGQSNGLGIADAAPPPPPPPPPVPPAPPLVDIGTPAAISLSDLKPGAGIIEPSNGTVAEAAVPTWPATEPVTPLETVAEVVAEAPPAAIVEVTPPTPATEYTYPLPATEASEVGVVEYGYPPVPEPPAAPTAAPIWEPAAPTTGTTPVWDAPAVPSAAAVPVGDAYPAVPPPLPPVYEAPASASVPVVPPPPPAPVVLEGAFGAPLVPPAPPVEGARNDAWMGSLADAIEEADAEPGVRSEFTGAPFVPTVTPFAAPPAPPSFGGSAGFADAFGAPLAPPPAPPAPPAPPSAWSTPTSLFDGGTPERLAPPPPPPPAPLAADGFATTTSTLTTGLSTQTLPATADDATPATASEDAADLERQLFNLSPRAREAVKQSSGLLGDGRGRR